MHNFLRYFRQNRKKIIRIAIFIAFLIILLQILDNFAKNNRNNEVNTVSQNIFEKTNGTIRSDRKMVTGGTVSETEINNVNSFIKDFVEKCNNGKAEEAYNMLTDNCKEVLYPSYEDFYNNYYKNLFENTKRTYSIENWANDIYIVRYTTDVLATGKTLENATYQDYITIVAQNGEKKLNINKYIGRVELNKTKDSDNIKAEVLYKDVFMDYEVYSMKITNNTNNTILMDSLLNADTIYLKDSKDIRHKAYQNELVKDDLKINKRTHKYDKN